MMCSCMSSQGGEWPERRGKRNDLIDMVSWTREDKGKSSFGDAIIATNGAAGRYERVFNRLQKEAMPPRDPSVPHTALWYYGEGRIGKSFLAHAENPDAYRKSCYNKWWSTYKGQKTAVYDEFTGKSS